LVAAGSDWGIRRFGFHGISHAYCAGQAAQILDQPLADLRLVICHLGNGCSASAVNGGKAVATTMGFTPLEGLMMGTRSGSIDPGIILHLLAKGLITTAQLETACCTLVTLLLLLAFRWCLSVRNTI